MEDSLLEKLLDAFKYVCDNKEFKNPSIVICPTDIGYSGSLVRDHNGSRLAVVIASAESVNELVLTMARDFSVTAPAVKNPVNELSDALSDLNRGTNYGR